MGIFKSRSFIDNDLEWLRNRIGNTVAEAGLQRTVVWPMFPAYAFVLRKDAPTDENLWDGDKHACFGFIDLVVLKLPDDGESGSAQLLVAILRPGKNAEIVSQLLDAFDVRIVRQAHDETRGEFATRAQAAVRACDSPADTPKKPLNIWERRVRRILRRALWLNLDKELAEDGDSYFSKRSQERPSKVAVWSEVPVQCVIGCEELEWELEGEQQRLNTHRMRTSVDVLVTTPAPEAEPLLAVEIDGPYHDNPAQQAKDELKDQLFREAEIPLVRVRIRDLNYDDHAMSLSFGSVYTRVLRELAQAVAPREPTKVEARAAALWKKIDRELAALHDQGKPFPENREDVLTPKERDDLFDIELSLSADVLEPEYLEILELEGRLRDIGIEVGQPKLTEWPDGIRASADVKLVDGTDLGHQHGPRFQLRGALPKWLTQSPERIVAIDLLFHRIAIQYGSRGRAAKNKTVG